jgi:hypothetical protein
MAPKQLSPQDVCDIFRRHPKGEIARLAGSLGCSHVAVVLVLNGKSTSARILAAARERALELLAEERQSKKKGAV